MTKQDAARAAAYREYLRTVSPIGPLSETWNAAWAAGVAHGRSENRALVELLREVYEYTDALEQLHPPTMMRSRSFEDLPGTYESREDLGDRVRAVLAVRAAREPGDRG